MLTIKEAQDIIGNFSNPNNQDTSLNTKRSFYSNKKIVNRIAYPNQQQNWLYELTAAQAKFGDQKDFKYVYNHIHCAPMLSYLANSLGINTAAAETAIKQQKLQMMSEAKKMRDNYLPYAEVERAMIKLK
ncbi:hypothetical protein OZY43_04860 [Lactobacillus sp. ESL0785]|uniref:hypothetical protein n=1 Tax=Lactobacillus sp. ESL0785 TaxID=2983232 RepID=UPI0023F6D91C|nr:hypothetical protein [Lactobacillus sp. ESL0785]WEV70287.1 hypothetical protein OZY43_04860 [Lactobacillus sp. ESL0785]